MARPRERKDDFDQKTLEVRRVTRVVEGGKRFSFRVLIAVGDGKGQAGIGLAKGVDVASAVEKAVFQAKKQLIRVPLTKVCSIPHEVAAKFGSAILLMKPAAEGRGIVAGGVVRTISALAGVRNITAKLLGSANKINNARATVLAFTRLKMPKNPSREAKQKKPE